MKMNNFTCIRTIIYTRKSFHYLGELRISIKSHMRCDVSSDKTDVTSDNIPEIPGKSTCKDAGAIWIITAARTSSLESVDVSLSLCSKNDSSYKHILR